MSLGVSVDAVQRGQSTLLEAPLISSYASLRATECARDFLLIGPSLINEADHRMGFGHTVAQSVLGNHDPRHDYDTMSLLRSDETAGTDERRAGRCGHFRKQFPLLR